MLDRYGHTGELRSLEVLDAIAAVVVNFQSDVVRRRWTEQQPSGDVDELPADPVALRALGYGRSVAELSREPVTSQRLQK